MSVERVYTKSEIESLSAKLIADIHNRNPHIELNELSMLLLYGASYILYTAQANESKLLPQCGALAYNYLTSSISNRYENATLSISTESSEVQGDNREDSKDSSEG